jgi:hypothetical protein
LTKRRIACLVGSADEAIARAGPDVALYTADTADGRRAIVELAARVDGSQLYGKPGDVRGARVPGVGSVGSVRGVADGIETEDELREVRAVLAEWCERAPRTAGEAAARLLAIRLPALDRWTHRIEALSSVFEAAIHAGPIECRDRILGKAGVYLDQRAAHLAAMEVGLPRGDWRQIMPSSGALRAALADPGVCVVADLEMISTEPRIPVREIVGTRHPIGHVRATVPGPIAAGALSAPGSEIVEVHRLLVCTRERWARYTEPLRREIERGGARKKAAKAVYQRTWGKMIAGVSLVGTVAPAVDVFEPDPDTFYSHEVREGGAEVMIQWKRGRYPATWYRPDLAAEIAGFTGSRTLDLAARAQRDGVPVALLHVDAVLGAPALAAHADPAAWSIKAEGMTWAWSPGRYSCGGVHGRMGGARGA